MGTYVYLMQWKWTCMLNMVKYTWFPICNPRQTEKYFLFPYGEWCNFYIWLTMTIYWNWYWLITSLTDWIQCCFCSQLSGFRCHILIRKLYHVWQPFCMKKGCLGHLHLEKKLEVRYDLVNMIWTLIHYLSVKIRDHPLIWSLWMSRRLVHMVCFPAFVLRLLYVVAHQPNVGVVRWRDEDGVGHDVCEW